MKEIIKFTDEQLISLVREYNHIYDLSDPNYHNVLLRENTWEKIGEKLKSTGQECKKKWKLLRECYRKAMHARSIKEQADKRFRPYRLESQMRFMQKHLNSQVKQNSNILPHSSPQSDESSSSFLTDESDSNNKNDEFKFEIETQQLEAPSFSKKTQATKKSSSATATETQNDYRNMNMFTTQHLSSTGDHLSKYFQSIEETVRTLPPRLQINLKAQISQLVHDAELENANV